MNQYITEEEAYELTHTMELRLSHMEVIYKMALIRYDLRAHLYLYQMNPTDLQKQWIEILDDIGVRTEHYMHNFLMFPEIK